MMIATMDGMNGYKCFANGKQCEVYAPETRYAAKTAQKLLKAKHAYDVTVMLVEVWDAEKLMMVPYLQTTAF